MARRCVCSPACKTYVEGGDCVAVTGSGTSVDPYVVNAEVSALAGNNLTCEADGLYVPAGDTSVADTDCIALSGDGSPGNPVTADPILSSDLCNLIECDGSGGDAGLKALLYTEDSECIALSGCGTLADPLIADPVIDPAVDNLLVCGVDGLYVQGDAVTVSTIDTDCIALSGDGSGGNPLQADPILSSDLCNLIECDGSGGDAGLKALLYTEDSDWVALSGCGTLADPLIADEAIFDTYCVLERNIIQTVPASAGACSTESAKIEYDFAFDDPQSMFDAGNNQIEIPASAGKGLYLIQLEERDDPDAVNYGADDVTIGVQVRLNGDTITSQRMSRYTPATHILNVSVVRELDVGDILEGYFNIHSNTGATVAHDLPLGFLGAGIPVYLMVTKLRSTT